MHRPRLVRLRVVLQRALVAAIAADLCAAVAAQDIADARVESALHAALLTQPVLVEAERIALPRVAIATTAGAWRRQFEDLPAALVALLERGAEAGGMWSADDFSAPAIVGLKAQIDAFVDSRTNLPRDAAAAAPAAFPAGTTAVVRLSRALVTPDQLDAILYGEWFCGQLCGEGSFVWLHRDSVSSAWRERKRITRWVS